MSKPDLLDGIIRSATDYAIISFDESNAVTTWSAGAETLLGWSAEEMLGQSGELIFTPEDRKLLAHEAELKTARAKGRAEDERWHVRKDGSRFWGSGVLVPLKHGAPPGFLKIIRDRTKEREAVLALHRSERRFRTLLENIPQLVWRAERPAELSWTSPQWESFTGLSRKESIGVGWLAAVHAEDHDATLQAWQEAERTGHLHVEHRLRRALGGEYRWFQTRGTRHKDEENGATEWLGASSDVHDLRRALERQQVLVRELHHRTRNLLGVVNALAHQTLSRSASMQEFSDRFYGRIAALARVQSLVARADAPALSLRELIETEIRAHIQKGTSARTSRDPLSILKKRLPRRWRWRCMNWRRMRSSTALSPRPSASSKFDGTLIRDHWFSSGGKMECRYRRSNPGAGTGVSSSR